MALKVALPLSGLSENIYAHCALLSPLPQDFDEDENLELLVDPLNPFRSIDEGIGSSNENVVRIFRFSIDISNRNEETILAIQWHIEFFLMIFMLAQVLA